MARFEADLRRFWAMTVDRFERIYVASLTEMLELMQTKALGVTAGGTLKTGYMPYVSTALVSSLTVTVGQSRSVGQNAYTVSLKGYKVGDYVSFFWDQPYAVYVERGDDKFAGWHFVEANAPKWEDIVFANARRIRNRRGYRSK